MHDCIPSEDPLRNYTTTTTTTTLNNSLNLKRPIEILECLQTKKKSANVKRGVLFNFLFYRRSKTGYINETAGIKHHARCAVWRKQGQALRVSNLTRH